MRKESSYNTEISKKRKLREENTERRDDSDIYNPTQSYLFG